MADETQLQSPELQGGEQQQQQLPPPPQIDQAAIAAAVKSAIGEMAREMPPARPQAPQPQPAADPMRDLLNPYLAPVQLGHQAVQDSVLFYTNPQNAWALEHQNEIEQIFQNWAAQGRAVPRADIAAYIRGRDFDKFAEARAKAQAEAQARATAATTVGFGSPGRAYDQPVRQASEMPIDELRRIMADVPF